MEIVTNGMVCKYKNQAFKILQMINLTTFLMTYNQKKNPLLMNLQHNTWQYGQTEIHGDLMDMKLSNYREGKDEDRDIY